VTAERPSPPERQFESPSGTAAPTAEGASIIPDLLHMIRQRMEALRPLVDEAAALEPHLQSWSAMRAPPRPLLGASPSKRLDAAALILKARELGEFSVRELAEALGDAEATTRRTRGAPCRGRDSPPPGRRSLERPRAERAAGGSAPG
jgi:hypothetical protein